MGIVSGYELHLYCDNANSEHAYKEFPHEYCDQRKSLCFKAARSDGWALNEKNNTAVCPKCSGKKRKGRRSK
jgi:hypothetical protein